MKEQFRREVPEGDHLERSICDHCGFIDYHNPRVVVGAIPVFENKILLARRAIEPRRGYWTVPGGFMEKGESLQEGAARETWEDFRYQNLLPFKRIIVPIIIQNWPSPKLL